MTAHDSPPLNEKEQRRRPCSSCGGYTFKSVAGVWRHWPYPPNFDTPIECRDAVIPPGSTNTEEALRG